VALVEEEGELDLPWLVRMEERVVSAQEAAEAALLPAPVHQLQAATVALEDPASAASGSPKSG
jgi:hypothetical protein